MHESAQGTVLPHNFFSLLIKVDGTAKNCIFPLDGSVLLSTHTAQTQNRLSEPGNLIKGGILT